MKRELLSDDELKASLADLRGWRVEGDTLRRTVECESFPAAIELVRRIADVAEELDHHPDIDIRWRTLHFSLTTHDRGGLTEFDFALARRVDALIAR